jgi:hypothetical protein
VHLFLFRRRRGERSRRRYFSLPFLFFWAQKISGVVGRTVLPNAISQGATALARAANPPRHHHRVFRWSKTHNSTLSQHDGHSHRRSLRRGAPGVSSPASQTSPATNARATSAPTNHRPRLCRRIRRLLLLLPRLVDAVPRRRQEGRHYGHHGGDARRHGGWVGRVWHFSPRCFASFHTSKNSTYPHG